MAMSQRDDPPTSRLHPTRSALWRTRRWTGMIEASADVVQLHRLADAGYHASVQNIPENRSDHFSIIF